MKVVKLGGSVITYKYLPLAPRYNVIRRLCKEIASSKETELIIVHGGGSFGHYYASKWYTKYTKCRQGKQSEQLKLLVAKTQDAMQKLNRIIVKYLVNAKIPAISLQTSAILISEDGEIKEFNLKVIEEMLAQGMVPVLYGDVVLDTKQGFSIVSGDTIACFLAKQFNAEKLIFCCDVDGVYDKDPKKYKDAKLLKEVDLSKICIKWEEVKSNSTCFDVTGSFFEKLMRLKRYKLGCECLIINGLRKDNLKLAIDCERVGTLVVTG